MGLFLDFLSCTIDLFISVFVPVPCCFDECSFVVESEARELDSSSPVFLFFFVFLPFLGPFPWHMEVPRLEVESEL